ncbi:MAG: hypothetical protein WA906_02235 [Pacificimonas sp.]
MAAFRDVLRRTVARRLKTIAARTGGEVVGDELHVALQDDEAARRWPALWVRERMR